jgi:hypothetical protein
MADAPPAKASSNPIASTTAAAFATPSALPKSSADAVDDLEAARQMARGLDRHAAAERADRAKRDQELKDLMNRPPSDPFGGLGAGRIDGLGSGGLGTRGSGVGGGGAGFGSGGVGLGGLGSIGTGKGMTKPSAKKPAQKKPAPKKAPPKP